MTKRATYRMVDENDPQFCRFWDAYPRRVAKKEARKTWAQLSPSSQLVDRMIAALEWQVPAFKWDGDSADFAPYPASWLNAERWTDERRITERRQQPDRNGHFPPCRSWKDCDERAFADAKRAREAS